MSDLTPMLQEVADRADATELLMPHEIRRAGERRRRRFVVRTAAFVVLGTVAASLVVSVATRDTASVDPAGQPTTTVSPDPADRVGFAGPPPPGTLPTGPATGELVAAAQFFRSTWVYADGRIINADGINADDPSDRFRGYVVRQLTPSGVEAMRDYILDGTPKLIPLSDNGGRLIVRVGDRLMEDRNYTGCVSEGQSRYCPDFAVPEDWLPASAWEDPTFRPFVPHSYSVCMMDLRRLGPAELLPTEAADILLASPESESDREGTCWVVANSVARQVADIMDQAGPTYVRQDSEGPVYVLRSDPGIQDFQLWFGPVLPHEDDPDYCWQPSNPC